MSYQTDRENFIARIAAEPMAPNNGGPPIHQRIDIARRLLTEAQRHQGYAVIDCNTGLTEAQQKRVNSCRLRIAALLHTLGQGFEVAELGGDPRGATVKIRVPSGYGDSWGDRSHYCVPVRG